MAFTARGRPLEYFHFEMFAYGRAKLAYKHFVARICRQILAERMRLFKVDLL